MKKILITFLFFGSLLIYHSAEAQKTTDTDSTYLIVKQNGTELIGKIISQSPYEVLLETKTIGQVAIPKSDIKQIKLLRKDEVGSGGNYNPDQPFATRYFITTNGLPIKKGDMYAQINLFGPEIQYGVTENFGVGLMTSWWASPIVLSAKYSHKLDDNLHIGVGTLLGTGSWSFPSFYMAVPFAAITYGDRKNNITISGGYGTVGYKTVTTSEREGHALLSIAGMATVNNKVSLIFDSFIVPDDGRDLGGFALLMPGMRFQTAPNKAFQFGFAGIIYTYTETINGEKVHQRATVPLPIPMLTWFRKI